MKSSQPKKDNPKETPKMQKSKEEELVGLNKELMIRNEMLERELQHVYHLERGLVSLYQEDPQPVIRWEVEGQLLFANEAGQKLLNQLESQQGNVPERFLKWGQEAFEQNTTLKVEFEVSSRIFEATIIPLFESHSINLYAIDFSRQREMARKLVQSEEKYRGIFENIYLGPLEIWPDGTIIKVYNGFCRLTQRCSEEIKGKRLQDVSEGFDFERFILSCSGTYDPGECNLIDKAGVSFPVLYSGTSFFCEGKLAFLLLFMDLRNKKELEQNLLQSVEQQTIIAELSQILNSLDDFDQRVQSSVDKIGIHLDVGQVFIYEDNQEEDTTTMKYEWCQPDFPRLKDQFQAIKMGTYPSWNRLLKENESIIVYDTGTMPKDASSLFKQLGIKSIISFPIVWKQKRHGFIGFSENRYYRHWSKKEIDFLKTITNLFINAYVKKDVEYQLQVREETYRNILGVLPDILLVVNEHYEIVWMRNEKELPPACLKALKKGDWQKKPLGKQLVQGVKEAAKSCSFQTILSFPFEWGLEEYEGRFLQFPPKEVLVVLRNVSRQKRYERQLQKAYQEAERAKNAEKDFLAHLSHEIRNPLNTVIGMVGLLEMTSLDENQKEYLGMCKSSADLLMHLLSDVLDLSRIEAGELSFEEGPFVIQEELDLMVDSFSPRIMKKNLQFNLNISPAVPQVITTDGKLVKHILINLLGNAIKFTSQGSISLQVDWEEDKGSKGVLKIIVQDTGIGIPKEEQGHVFDKFKQSSQVRMGSFGGTGLGLYIISQMVAVLKGTISLEGEKGVGSTFTVSLPVEKIKEGGALLKKEQPVSVKCISPVKILIVEDNAFNAHYLKELLIKWGMDPHHVADGSKAVELAATMDFDLIFMDLNVPIMDGYEITKHLRQMPSFRKDKVPIIAVTGNALASERQRALHGGMNDFISKPFTPVKILQVLSNYFSFLPDEEEEESLSFSGKFPFIDYDHIKALYTGDSDHAQEMFFLFIKKSSQWIPQLFQAVDKKDQAAVFHHCHKGKATFSMVGLMKGYQILHKIEMESKKESCSFEKVRGLAEELKDVFPLWIEGIVHECSFLEQKGTSME